MQKIRQLRQILNLGQKEFAESIGIAQNSLSNYETGKRTPSPELIKKIAQKYDVPTDYLLDNDRWECDHIAAALKNERKIQHLTVAEVAEASGVAIPDIQAYETGEAPINDYLLRRICLRAYGKSLSEFLIDQDLYDEYIPAHFNGDVDAYEAFKKAAEEDAAAESYRGARKIPDDPNIFVPKLKKVPLLGTTAAGEPILSDEYFEGYVNTTEDADFCLKVKGDSMIGIGINDGDIIFVKAQETVENGQVAVVRINNDAVTLKRLYRKDDSVILQSENPAVMPMIYNASNCDDFKILGLAIIKQSPIK